MRTFLALSITTGILLGTVDSSLAKPEPVRSDWEPHGPCFGWQTVIQRGMDLDKVRTRVAWIIRCAVRIWPVQGGLPMALCVAAHESGPYLVPWALNPYSGAGGTFQVLASTWRGWRRAHPVLASWTHPSRFEARSNVLFSIRVASDTDWYPWFGATYC